MGVDQVGELFTGTAEDVEVHRAGDAGNLAEAAVLPERPTVCRAGRRGGLFHDIPDPEPVRREVVAMAIDVAFVKIGRHVEQRGAGVALGDRGHECDAVRERRGDSYRSLLPPSSFLACCYQRQFLRFVPLAA